MNVSYQLVGTKATKKIKVRINLKGLDLVANTDLSCNAENWDFENKCFKVKNKRDFESIDANRDLTQLKINIEKSFFNDFRLGVLINRQWLENTIRKDFSRPSTEEKLLNPDHTVYLYEFGQWWLKNNSEKWLNSKAELLDNKAKSQKANSLQLFKEFEAEEKVQLSQFSEEKIKAFYNFLIGKKYSIATAKKVWADIKFLCKRAKELKYNVNLDFNDIVFHNTQTKIDDIYLTEKEIESIFNYDFSDNDTLDIIRDNFILGLWTGLRISDLSELNLDNFINHTIESVSIKTKTFVKLPSHRQVKAILQKRFGNLPPKVNKDDYNREIKVICMLCGIDTMTLGKVFDPEKKRKITAYYPKYKLVTSHTARRSFATNLSKYNMTSLEIAKAGGWSSTRMVEHYIKQTPSEIADKIDSHWNANL